MINGAVAVLVGLYLLLAVSNGNQGKMLATISDQTGFVKWAGALLTMGYLYSVVGGKGGEVIKAFVVLALAAMILDNGNRMFGQMQQVFKPTNK